MFSKNPNSHKTISPADFDTLEENLGMSSGRRNTVPTGKGLWWFKTVGIGITSLFFLFFGIETLLGAYSLKNPLDFIMFFFSASFLILLSSVGICFTFFKIRGYFKLRKKYPDEK